MTANLPAYDTLLRYCRQFLPEERITRVRNLVWLMLSLLHSTDGHLSSLAEVIALEATELSVEQPTSLTAPWNGSGRASLAPMWV